MRKFTKSLMTLALLCVAGVANAQDEWVDLPVTGWVHEWRTNDAQTDGEAQTVDGAYKVYVRSEEDAKAAGNMIKDSNGNLADYDSQFFITFGEDNKLAAGDVLKVTMEVKADVAVTVGTQSHAAPGGYLHWYCIGDVAMSTSYTEIIKEVEVTNDYSWGHAQDGMYTIAFNLAKGAANNCYFKNIKVQVKKLPFDTSKNHMLKVTNGAAKTNPYDYQANYTLSTPLTAGKTYVFTAAIKAVNGGETRLVPNGDGAQYLADKGLWTNEFTRCKYEFEATGNHTKLEIDLGKCGGEVYFDNVSLVEKGESTNLIANGDFETQGTTGWSTSTSWAGTTLEQVEYELGTVKDPGILVDVDDKGWIAFRTGSNIEISDPNVKAYVAKYVANNNCLLLSEVTAVPSWQPVLIQAPKGKYMLDIPASVQGFPYDKNNLKANGGSTLSEAGLYMLDMKDDGVGFYPVSSVHEWQIYVQVPNSDTDPDPYPEFLEFVDQVFAVTIDDGNVDAANWKVWQKAGKTVSLKYKGKKKVKSITVTQE